MTLMLHEALSETRWQKKPELARQMGCTERDVEHEIERARKAAELPIMSSGLGYRLAVDPDEYAANVDRRHKRALVQLVTVQGERRLLDEWRERVTPAPAPNQVALPW